MNFFVWMLVQVKFGSTTCTSRTSLPPFGAAKIADVGLARFMESDHVTQMGVMGTLAWAAPEVLR